MTSEVNKLQVLAKCVHKIIYIPISIRQRKTRISLSNEKDANLKEKIYMPFYSLKHEKSQFHFVISLPRSN